MSCRLEGWSFEALLRISVVAIKTLVYPIHHIYISTLQLVHEQITYVSCDNKRLCCDAVVTGACAAWWGFPGAAGSPYLALGCLFFGPGGGPLICPLLVCSGEVVVSSVELSGWGGAAGVLGCVGGAS